MLGGGRQSQPYMVVHASHAVVMANAWPRRKTNTYSSRGCHFDVCFAKGENGPKSASISSFYRPWLYLPTIMSIISRFAPSPTGFLHLGHAFSAWTAWARADRFWLRLEDIDTTRCRPEFSAAIFEDLAWLGLDWEPEVRVQSEHFPDYGAALQRLERRGLLYPCFCSRAEILRAQAAPHGA